MTRSRDGACVAVALGAIALAAAARGATGAVAPPGSIVHTMEPAAGTRALGVSRADGTSTRQITGGPNDYNARWSPDGLQIAFERSTAQDETAVWVVNPDGSDARELEADPYSEHPRWSPNGRWIAYQIQTSFNIHTTERASTTFELHLERPSRSGHRLLVPSEPTSENDNPRAYVQFGMWSWSPDSTRIAFTRPRSPTADSWSVNVVDVATRRVRLLLRGGKDPDGRPMGGGSRRRSTPSSRSGARVRLDLGRFGLERRAAPVPTRP